MDLPKSIVVVDLHEASTIPPHLMSDSHISSKQNIFFSLGVVLGLMGWWYSTSKFLKNFGGKTWTPHVTLAIEYSSEREQRILHMRMGRSQKWNTSESLGVRVTFSMIRRTLENLMQRMMKVSFSGTQPLARHIESSTREQKRCGVHQCGYWWCHNKCSKWR